MPGLLTEGRKRIFFFASRVLPIHRRILQAVKRRDTLDIIFSAHCNLIGICTPILFCAVIRHCGALPEGSESVFIRTDQFRDTGLRGDSHIIIELLFRIENIAIGIIRIDSVDISFIFRFPVAQQQVFVHGSFRRICHFTVVGIHAVPQTIQCGIGLVDIVFHTEIRHKGTEVGVGIHLVDGVHVLPVIVGTEGYAPSLYPLSCGIGSRIRSAVGNVEGHHGPAGSLVIRYNVSVRIHGYGDLGTVPALGPGHIVALYIQLLNAACSHRRGSVELHSIRKKVIEHHMLPARGHHVLVMLRQIIQAASVINLIAVISCQIVIHQHTVVVRIIFTCIFLIGLSRHVEPAHIPESIVADQEMVVERLCFFLQFRSVLIIEIARRSIRRITYCALLSICLLQSQDAGEILKPKYRADFVFRLLLTGIYNLCQHRRIRLDSHGRLDFTDCSVINGRMFRHHPVGFPGYLFCGERVNGISFLIHRDSACKFPGFSRILRSLRRFGKHGIDIYRSELRV